MASKSLLLNFSFLEKNTGGILFFLEYFYLVACIEWIFQSDYDSLLVIKGPVKMATLLFGYTYPQDYAYYKFNYIPFCQCSQYQN